MEKLKYDTIPDVIVSGGGEAPVPNLRKDLTISNNETFTIQLHYIEGRKLFCIRGLLGYLLYQGFTIS